MTRNIFLQVSRRGNIFRRNRLSIRKTDSPLPSLQSREGAEGESKSHLLFYNSFREAADHTFVFNFDRDDINSSGNFMACNIHAVNIKNKHISDAKYFPVFVIGTPKAKIMVRYTDKVTFVASPLAIP